MKNEWIIIKDERIEIFMKSDDSIYYDFNNISDKNVRC